MSIRSYIQSPPEKYPGFLTAKYGNDHVVIYKDSLISSWNKINIGNKITHINDIKTEDYFEKYIMPFYANDDSEFSQRAASIFSFIINGNRCAAIPLAATLINDKVKQKIPLTYTELLEEALSVSKNIRQPEPDQHFKIEMVSSGVWITIRSFYLSREETIFYTVMLSQLKELVKEDWILFDLRNNRGGDPFGQGLLFAIYGEMIILNIQVKIMNIIALG